MSSDSCGRQVQKIADRDGFRRARFGRLPTTQTGARATAPAHRSSISSGGRPSEGASPLVGTLQKACRSPGGLARKARIPENELVKSPAGSYSSRPASREAKARIAQLVEQLAFNQLVLGSSPSPRIFSVSGFKTVGSAFYD